MLWLGLGVFRVEDSPKLVDAVKTAIKNGYRSIDGAAIYDNEVITIPKSTNEGRIIENSQIFDFELTNEEVEKINSLNQDLRVGPDPDNFDF